ncbi:MAG: polysaccharide deacetylase family protein [Lachnospiraceae bacterium]|nr:polysaccharide deacetylase family protein [Lachnospiraceae bacterium]
MNQFKKYFTLSYDDGLEQDKQTIALMKKYGIKGTFNLNSAMFGEKSNIKYFGTMGFENVDPSVVKRGLIKTGPANRIPADEIRQVYEGFELATHTAHHANMKKLSKEETEAELLRDREALSHYTDLPVVGHAFPYGSKSPSQIEVMRENGFLYGRGVRNAKGKGEDRFAFPENPLDFAPTCWHIDKNIKELFQEFLSITPTKGDMMFYMWGHGYEFDFDAMKKREILKTLEWMFDQVANNDSIIPCTNAEAFLDHAAAKR